MAADLPALALAGLTVCGLAAYLIYVLLHPEQF